MSFLEKLEASRNSCLTHLIKNDWHVPLKFDRAVPGTLLTFPSPARGYYTQTFFLTLWGDSSRLPPFVIASVRHVQNFAIAERQAAARQTIVFVGIVIEQRSLGRKYCHIYFRILHKLSIYTRNYVLIKCVQSESSHFFYINDHRGCLSLI